MVQRRLYKILTRRQEAEFNRRLVFEEVYSVHKLPEWNDLKKVIHNILI